MKIRNYNNDDYLEVALILKDSDLFDEVWDSEDNLKSKSVQTCKLSIDRRE